MNDLKPTTHKKVGKRVGGALYLHKDALSHTTSRVRQAVERAVHLADITPEAFNVLKIEGMDPKRISLLSYEPFDRFAFPSLLDSWTVDLEAARCSHRTYRGTSNPPILHRKELLLAPDDSRREDFSKLTQELERRGLFQDAKSIGFRRQWEQRLATAGVAIRDHFVVEAKGEADTDCETPSVE